MHRKVYTVHGPVCHLTQYTDSISACWRRAEEREEMLRIWKEGDIWRVERDRNFGMWKSGKKTKECGFYL